MLARLGVTVAPVVAAADAEADAIIRGRRSTRASAAERERLIFATPPPPAEGAATVNVDPLSPAARAGSGPTRRVDLADRIFGAQVGTVHDDDQEQRP